MGAHRWQRRGLGEFVDRHPPCRCVRLPCGLVSARPKGAHSSGPTPKLYHLCTVRPPALEPDTPVFTSVLALDKLDRILNGTESPARQSVGRAPPLARI